MKAFKPIRSMICVLVLASTLAAQDANSSVAELVSYTAQKYHKDYNAQTEKSQADIAKEYAMNIRLSDAVLDGAMKEDIDYKVASRLLAVDIWVQKFMRNAKIDEDKLQALYQQINPKVSASYYIDNILFKKDADAAKALKTISAIKDATAKLGKFKQLAQNESLDVNTRKNGGVMGWVDANQLDDSLKSSLKEVKKGDIVKVEIKNIGYQLLFIEDVKPEHPATFEESKPTLETIARRELLNQEIQKILSAQ